MKIVSSTAHKVIPNDKIISKKSDDEAFRKAVEVSDIGVWDWNSVTGKVNYSPESLNILGFSTDEIQPNHEEWDKRVHPEDRESYFENFNLHLNNLLPYYINEHRIMCKDGKYKWILDKGKIVERAINGKPLRILGTHTDITELKENEFALKKSIDITKRQVTRLKSFTHIVSHNLKSHIGNLQAIISYYEEAKNNEERQELFCYIKTISNTLTNTIGHLNELVAIKEKGHEVELLNINTFINKTILLLENEIVKTNAKIINYIDEDLKIYFNSAYLESIVLNLLSNAIKYKHPDREPVIKINSIINSKIVQFLITDNGLGIDLDKYGKDIFQLYRTFHKNENAEGVGLYLIKSQIESLGGSITLESKVDVGTTFIITFNR